jgi:N-glycosylase/DNA lyase
MILESWATASEIALPLRGEPLSLDESLACGQAFRWVRLGTEEWEGVAGGRAWRVRLGDDALHARSAPAAPPAELASFLSRYFALDLPIGRIQREVATAHPVAAAAVEQFPGLRILRQPAEETVLTFAIATATNVPRVTRSVRELACRFGSPLAAIDGVVHYNFPTVEQILAAPTDRLFTECNLAYRARSLQAIARELARRPAGWLDSLDTLPYPDAHRALDELPGYGPKVSDCACLFGLGFHEAVPVDVHVWAIAHELFGTEIPTRTLTPLTYQKIGRLFRDTFGEWAGWAQQYLFCARRAVPVALRFRPPPR